MISTSLVLRSVVQCLALVLIAFATENAAHGNGSHPVPAADQNATTDAENGPPWERPAMCSVYAKCREKPFRKFIRCAGGVIPMLLADQNITAAHDDSCGTDQSARCVDELVDELGPTLSGLHKQIHNFTVGCVESESVNVVPSPENDALKESCDRIRPTYHRGYLRGVRECEQLEVCCPKYPTCRQRMENASDLAQREQQVLGLYQKCIRGVPVSVQFDDERAEQLDHEVSTTKPATNSTTVGTPDEITSSISDGTETLLNQLTAIENGTKTSFNGTNHYIPRGREAILIGKELRKIALREWSERVNLLAKDFYAKLKARQGNATKPDGPSPRSPRGAAVAPQGNGNRDKRHCKLILECEAKLEARRRKCWHKGSRHGVTNWYLWKRLFDEKNERSAERKKCADRIADPETQEEIEMLYAVIQGQNHECVRSRRCYQSRVRSEVAVEGAAEHRKCQSELNRNHGSESSDRDDGSDGGDRGGKSRIGGRRRRNGRNEGNDSGESLDSEEHWNSHYCDHDNIRRLERKCTELRDCCPRLERCEQNNDSREVRKLTKIAKHLRDELDMCENRRSHVGESTYRKFNSAVSTKNEGGVEWEDELEEKAGD